MSAENRLLKLSDNFDAWRDKLNTQAEYYNKLFSIISPALPIKNCGRIEIGDFVGANTNTSSTQKYIKATKPKTIIGVYYDLCNNIIVNGGEHNTTKQSYALVCTTGVVHAKVSGSISVGDELVLSSTAGVARKYISGSDNTRNIIGYALETNTSTDVKLVKIKI